MALRNGWEFSRSFSFSLSNDKRKAAASVMIAVTRRFHSLTGLMSVMGMLQQQSIIEMFSPGVPICFTLTRTGIERRMLAVLGAKKEIAG